MINSFAFRINHWIEAKKPRVYQETGIKLLHTESHSVDTVKLLFEAKGNILFPKNSFWPVIWSGVIFLIAWMKLIFSLIRSRSYGYILQSCDWSSHKVMEFFWWKNTWWSTMEGWQTNILYFSFSWDISYSMAILGRVSGTWTEIPIIYSTINIS